MDSTDTGDEYQYQIKMYFGCYTNPEFGSSVSSRYTFTVCCGARYD